PTSGGTGGGRRRRAEGLPGDAATRRVPPDPEGPGARSAHRPIGQVGPQARRVAMRGLPGAPTDPLVLSPMVDVTDAAFRSIAREWGADVTCSEMVAAIGLNHDRPAAWRDVEPWPGESPY